MATDFCYGAALSGSGCGISVGASVYSATRSFTSWGTSPPPERPPLVDELHAAIESEQTTAPVRSNPSLRCLFRCMVPPWACVQLQRPGSEAPRRRCDL